VRRSRALLTLGVTAGLLVLAWGGATLYAAGQAEQTGNDAARTLDTALKANHLGRVREHTFTRGLTGSTDDLYLVLDDPLGGGTGAPDAPVIHLRNHVQNGPFPGVQHVAQAVVDTEFIWDARTQQRLDRAFGGQKPVIRTVVGFGGNTTTTVQVPAGTYALDGETATWQALAAEVSVSDAGRGVNGTLTWPGFSVGGEEGTTSLSTLAYSVQQRPYLTHLSRGTSTLSVRRIQFPGKLGHLDGLSLTSTTAPNGANLDSRSDLRAAGLSLMGQTYLRPRVSLSAHGLNSEALEGLSAVMKGPEYQTGFKSEDPAVLSASLKKLLKDAQGPLKKLLAGNPLLKVDEVSLQTPQGPLKLVLGAQVVDGGSIPIERLLVPETLSQPSESPELLGLLDHLKLTADVSGSQLALATLAGESGDDTAASLAESIDPMVEQGMVTRQGDLLSTHLEFGKNGALINGKPVPGF